MQQVGTSTWDILTIYSETMASQHLASFPEQVWGLTFRWEPKLRAHSTQTTTCSLDRWEAGLEPHSERWGNKKGLDITGLFLLVFVVVVVFK